MASRAYSYVRFSSRQQAHGDSLRRQIAAAEKYAADNDLVLDISYRDPGISAWKGDNATKGALSVFLEAVEAKRIPSGSYLLVEALDRLSRQDLDEALLLFMSIIQKGVTIVTLQDGFVYSKEVIKKNPGALHMSIAYLAGANNESNKKSERLKEVNAEKRKRGEVRLGNLPAWLSHKDGKVFVREDRAAVVRWIFERAIVGDGSPTIAKKLNTGEGVPQELLHPTRDGFHVPTFVSAEYWSSSNVAATLRNVAVTGTLHQKRKVHEPVANHYPVIVEQEVFDRARAQTASRLMKGGRKGVRVANLFAGMTFCECGSKMRVVSNGDYMRCLKSYNGANCDAPRAPIEPIEDAILRHFNVQRRGVYGYSELDSPDLSVALRDQVHAQEKRVNNLLEMVAATGFTPALRNMLETEQSKLSKLSKELDSYSPPAPTDELVDDLMRWKSAKSGEERLRLQTAVRRILSKIVVEKATTTLVGRPSEKTQHVRRVQATFARSGSVRHFRYQVGTEGRAANGKFAKGNKSRPKAQTTTS